MVLKEYNSLPNYLTRKTLISFKRLHIRFHNLLSEDKTPFLHNHPFYFISIILKNGYEEEYLDGSVIKTKQHKVGSVIFRTPKDFHRIKSINGETKTLFITWKVPIKWSLKKHPNLSVDMLNLPEYEGIYIRFINGRERFCKFDKFWYIGHDTPEAAMKEDRLSVHQCIDYKIGKNEKHSTSSID